MTATIEEPETPPDLSRPTLERCIDCRRRVVVDKDGRRTCSNKCDQSGGTYIARFTGGIEGAIYRT